MRTAVSASFNASRTRVDMVIGKVWVTDVQIQSRAVAEPACIEQRRATRVCLKDVAGRPIFVGSRASSGYSRAF